MDLTPDDLRVLATRFVTGEITIRELRRATWPGLLSPAFDDSPLVPEMERVFARLTLGDLSVDTARSQLAIALMAVLPPGETVDVRIGSAKSMTIMRITGPHPPYPPSAVWSVGHE